RCGSPAHRGWGQPQAVSAVCPGACRRVRLRLASGAGRAHNPAMNEDVVTQDELRALLAARRELGDEMEPAVIEAFAARMERLLADRAGQREGGAQGREGQPKG